MSLNPLCQNIIRFSFVLALFTFNANANNDYSNIESFEGAQLKVINLSSYDGQLCKIPRDLTLKSNVLEQGGFQGLELQCDGDLEISPNVKIATQGFLLKIKVKGKITFGENSLIQAFTEEQRTKTFVVPPAPKKPVTKPQFSGYPLERRNGRDATNHGQPGLEGAPGEFGLHAGAIVITAQSFEGTLTIKNNGTNGGPAGPGGPGGDGVPGENGGPSAGSYEVAFGAMNCRGGAKRGGQGSNAGLGGLGGTGGLGGNGGDILIQVADLDPNYSQYIEALGGLGGKPGKSATAGTPGPGGFGGKGDGKGCADETTRRQGNAGKIIGSVPTFGPTGEDGSTGEIKVIANQLVLELGKNGEIVQIPEELEVFLD